TAAAGAWWRLHRDEAGLAILVEQVAADPVSSTLATRLLGEFGPAATTAVPALRRLRAADRDPWSTSHAALALWRVTDDPGELLPTVRRLWPEHPFLRGAFARCLAAMGSRAAATLPLVRDESAEPHRFFARDGKPTTIDIDADERLSR